jgi:hypothetical protein
MLRLLRTHLHNPYLLLHLYNKFKFQQAPKGEVESGTTRRHTPIQKKYLSFLIYITESQEISIGVYIKTVS